MKTLLLLICALLLPQLAFGVIGPDLSAGTDVAYFKKLRLDYAKAPKTEYFPNFDNAPDREAMERAFSAKDITETLKIAEAWLTVCPVDAEAHLITALALRQKGDYPGYFYHYGVYNGLLQSIMDGKDGKSPETAYVVISVAEEYFLFRAIGAKMVRQSLIAEGGPCDKMELTRGEGEDMEAFTLYFNVAISMKAMDAALTKGNTDETKGE